VKTTPEFKILPQWVTLLSSPHLKVGMDSKNKKKSRKSKKQGMHRARKTLSNSIFLVHGNGFGLMFEFLLLPEF
jgi:hypothetical protein